MTKNIFTKDDYYLVANGLIDLARKAREEGGVTADQIAEQQQVLSEICAEVFPERAGYYNSPRMSVSQTAELV